MAEPAIVVSGLRKTYENHDAVRGIDFQVERGEVFGFLGTNGAGKTTTIEILEGYRERTDGEVSVLGSDPEKAPPEWRDRIGMVLQESQPDPTLTVEETLQLYAGLYLTPRSVPETIDLVGLKGRERDRVGNLVVGTATMCILGIALTAVTPTADAAATIAPLTAVLLSFISGVFIPVDQLPNWLEEIGRVFPLAHLADGLQTTLAPATTGSGLSGENLGVLALWGVAGLVVAVRRFSREPQAAHA